MSIDHIAALCHETVRIYCLLLGDTSQPLWSDAPAWQRNSAMRAVKEIISNPFVSPSFLHRRWVEDKLLDGWIYGPVKDPALKQHPCIVPWDELPIEQKRKDVLFMTVVFACQWTDRSDPSGLRPRP